MFVETVFMALVTRGKDGSLPFGRYVTFYASVVFQWMFNHYFHSRSFWMLFRYCLAAVYQEIPQDERDNIGDLLTMKYQKGISPWHTLCGAEVPSG